QVGDGFQRVVLVRTLLGKPPIQRLDPSPVLLSHSCLEFQPEPRLPGVMEVLRSSLDRKDEVHAVIRGPSGTASWTFCDLVNRGEQVAELSDRASVPLAVRAELLIDMTDKEGSLLEPTAQDPLGKRPQIFADRSKHVFR